MADERAEETFPGRCLSRLCAQQKCRGNFAVSVNAKTVTFHSEITHPWNVYMMCYTESRLLYILTLV